MGKIKDYTHAVKRGLRNATNVFEGNLNRVRANIGILPEDQKEEAERRFNICVDCPFNSFNASERGFYDTHRTDLHCSLCACPIESKVMAFNERCGLSVLTYTTNEQGQQVSGLYGFNKPLWTEYTPKE